MASVSNICQTCQLRPKYFDAAINKQHDFCSRTCANASIDTCEYCHSRPKYRDSKSNYQFCGKRCAQAAKAAGIALLQQGQAAGSLSGSDICSIPECLKQVYIDANGKASKYCGRAHQGLGEAACLSCLMSKRSQKSHFCQPCEADLHGKAPTILEIPEQHEAFKDVTSQFKQNWKHRTPCPTVRAVYKIVLSQKIVDQYESYRSTVEARGNFVATGQPFGNERRRWHGTTRECTLGDKECTKFCSSDSCSLCHIIRTSFDLKMFGKNKGWGRYGTGIYTSATSSKSNDYSENRQASTRSPWKAILLNKVVVGKGYKIKKNNDKLTAPPAGYDSVLGEVGIALNYDELVVYNNDAVRPSYLVMYDK